MKVLDNIKKLFSYNWPQLLRKLIPGGQKKVISKEDYNNIKVGAIIRIVGIAFAKIAAIGIAVYTVVKAYSTVYSGNIISYAIQSAITSSMGKWILEIVYAAIIPIGILVYNEIMKNKEQNGWVNFIILLVSLFQTLVALYGIIGWLAAFIVNPLFALLGLVSVLCAFVGNVSIAVGCIEFLTKLVPVEELNNSVGSYQPSATPVGSYQPSVQPVQPTEPVAPVQPVQPVQSVEPVQPVAPVQPMQPVQPTINTQVVNQEPMTQQTVNPTSSAVCPNCGNATIPGAGFCNVCGNKL